MDYTYNSCSVVIVVQVVEAGGKIVHAIKRKEHEQS